MKKFLSVVLVISMIFFNSSITFATTVSEFTITGKMAIVTDVSDNGENLTDDQHSKNNSTI